MENIQFNIENGIANITLNRPEVYNSFNDAMSTEFKQALDECGTNEDVRVILISGAGKAFCAGQDLKEATAPEAPEIGEIVSKHYNPIIEKICALEKPVVAAINGVAAGAGANIALACDIVVAKESAHFIQAFCNIGLIPDSGGTFFLPRLIGLKKASALMMLGDKVSAKEAERMGMIYKYFPDDEFDAAVQKLCDKLVLMPTKGLGLIKKALHYSLNNDLTTQLGIEEALQTTASHTDDYNEGVQAFLEKRKPTFTGK